MRILATLLRLFFSCFKSSLWWEHKNPLHWSPSPNHSSTFVPNLGVVSPRDCVPHIILKLFGTTFKKAEFKNVGRAWVLVVVLGAITYYYLVVSMLSLLSLQKILSILSLQDPFAKQQLGRRNFWLRRAELLNCHFLNASGSRGNQPCVGLYVQWNLSQTSLWYVVPSLCKPLYVGRSKYSEHCLKLGSTPLITNGIEMPQCILCRVVFSSESILNSKLKISLRD